MREVLIEPDFRSWRSNARELLAAEVPPHQVFWKEKSDAQDELPGLFSGTSSSSQNRNSESSTSGLKGNSDVESFREAEVKQPAKNSVKKAARVPPAFLAMAEFASAHRSASKWSLLYRILWRLAHEDPHLLDISIDDDIAELDSLVRMVRKDMHKMKAFVRFREVKDETGSQFIAWHRPDHRIVPLVAPFFARRFSGMRWTILTDDLSVRWEGKELEYLPGCPRSEAPTEDALEEVWKTYYSSTFNPARIKLGTMKKEMAVRYWDTMPETAVIRDLIRDSSARLDAFFESQKVSARDWFPKVPEAEWTLPLLAEAARACRACTICESATQTVFGEGNADSEIVFVGEQPGDQEDRAGRPFVGPAGKLFDRLLGEAGVDRGDAYVTNAVKHFKWIPSGKIRLHQKPVSSEVAACQSWLRAELGIVKPKILICLGATAAQAVIGRSVRLEDVRGKFFSTQYCELTFVMNHPSALLREKDPELREAQESRFREELVRIRTKLAELRR